MKRLALVSAFLLACCAPQPTQQVRPALWEVTGPEGERAWLFGTIHALPAPVDWRSPAIDRALDQSDLLVLEIDNADDPGALGRIFASLSTSPGLPPVADRLDAPRRKRLSAAMAELGLSPRDLAGMETWAAALTLSRAATAESHAAFGLESELMEAARGKPVAQLEGAEAQLRMFDGLPETEQQDLLAGVVEEALSDRPEDILARAWASGDMATIDREAHAGLLADPELRDALLVKRNRAWVAKIAAMLAKGRRPLVAVGAAHMAGPDGLPALLTAQGLTVRRVQ